ncbi:acyl-CoA dehydrogenase family protein [Nocardia sp. NPDC056000]|uniref:acyl-CoA dehydrogenase family protein n=1 Tax=Nocardia sp. NPDC056000 TaxID=3345674 RepID=UPI0035DE9809
MNARALVEVIESWFEPLRPILDQDDSLDWRRLKILATTLDEAVQSYLLTTELTSGPERSRALQEIRSELALRGMLDTTGQPMVFAALAQFLCGYRDIDLRDAFGLGHGVLIDRYGKPRARQRWVPQLLAGQLAGIAITESHGGSNPAATRTTATAATDGTWLVTGRKTWISRLAEAAVFIVFFRAPDGTMAAATIDATSPRLHRHPIEPAGLAGWAWGVLDLDAVVVRPEDVLCGEGMAMLRQHFARYRPLVTSTALGGAAALFDEVTESLAARLATPAITRLRDSALVTVGRSHVQLVTALLGAIAAGQLAETAHPDTERWGAATKAHGIDIANQTAADLALLVGAEGFRAHGRLAKIRRDLSGLLYADGIHDSLYRAAGKQHTAMRKETTTPARASGPLLESL